MVVVGGGVDIAVDDNGVLTLGEWLFACGAHSFVCSFARHDGGHIEAVQAKVRMAAATAAAASSSSGYAAAAAASTTTTSTAGMIQQHASFNHRKIRRRPRFELESRDFRYNTTSL
jgi:hypothetical protein